MSETTDPTAGEHPAENDAPEPICAKAYCGERAYCSEAGECLAARVPATPDTAGERGGHRTFTFGQSSADGDACRDCSWQGPVGSGQQHRRDTAPATPDAGDASECDGCQKRPCVCETVVLPSTEGLSEAEREAGGRLVREVWIEWAREQPNPKSSWLVPWEGLSEPDREVDRRIAERVGAAREAAARAEERERIAQAIEASRYLLLPPGCRTREDEAYERAARIARESR